MSKPGWYPDPYGTGSLRWWDGEAWTERLNPEPAGPPRPRTPAPERRPERPERGERDKQDEQPERDEQDESGGPVPPAQRPAWEQGPVVQPLDVTVRGLRLYADDERVAYGQASLVWPRVEWVAYWAAERPAGYGHSPAVQWIFQVGRYPFHGGPRVEVVLEPEVMPGREGEPEHAWGRLVRLCQEYAEPRLVEELARRVRAGESIDVAQGLTVHPGGVRGSRVSLSWISISGAAIDRGRVWIQQASISSPILYVPQQNPNAVLIPALLARLKR